MLRSVSVGATARRFLSIPRDSAVVSHRRCSAVSGDPSLLGALESRIKATELNLMKKRGVPADLPFTIQDDNKHCHVMLTRELGREKIEVTANLVHEPECVRINVSISKEKKGKLSVGANVFAGEILADRISFCEPDSYYVPSLRVEAKGELQGALNDFVKARGVEISSVGFLYKYMVSKRRRWSKKTPRPKADDLKKFRKFVENW
ncbi:hypothetical protein AAHA92_04620 [Salvia divinorum]|uniref:Uncharacterized protein n=1 Tax=Salvia divinorum TaxID=28513 RepID=A0ABD1I1U5_SALDI